MQTGSVNALCVVAGALGVVWILNDIFKQVLVPRAVEGTARISVLLARFSWIVGRFVVRRLPPDGFRREEMLGFFAPLYFIMLLGIWLFALMLSYGLILYGLRDEISPVPPDFGSTIYFAA